MASIFDVNPNNLIEEAAKELKKLPGIQPPEWTQFVKTGLHKERPPVNPDWWYVRLAAVLRSIYLLGPIGVSKLRTKYGGKQNRGYAPEKFVKSSGNIIRKALQQLEVESLIAKSPDDKKKGRVIAPKGQSLLERSASSLVPKKEKVSGKKAGKKSETGDAEQASADNLEKTAKEKTTKEKTAKEKTSDEGPAQEGKKTADASSADKQPEAPEEKPSAEKKEDKPADKEPAAQDLGSEDKGKKE